MTRQTSRKTRELRDMAVLAVARRGALERSGAASLAILHERGLMIGYHTPFNPLPKMSDSAQYDAACRGKQAAREPYGIEIWLDGAGKVFTAGWTFDSEPHVRLCKRGAWQEVLKNIVHDTGEEQIVMPSKKKTPEVVAQKDIVAVPVVSAIPDGASTQRLRQLEQENKHLRRAISGLMLDKLILAKAAAGKL